MNYRHIYHAGNFADVIKHCIVLSIIEALKRKSTPFCVLDTHAGIGLYSLYSPEAQKKREYQQGTAKLFSTQMSSDTPDIMKQYLAILHQMNPNNNLNFYPGSPLLILKSIRHFDRLIASELHEEDVYTLKQATLSYENSVIHSMNGYHAMKAFLPPKEARGVVLIDPPFEKTTEFSDIIKHLKLALKSWRGGVYAIWYPLKENDAVKMFYSELKSLGFPVHIVETTLQHSTNPSGLNACGVAIINAPWQLPELLTDTLLPFLSQVLGIHFTNSSYSAS